MNLRISTHDLLVFLAYLLITVLLILKVVAVYKRRKKRQQLKEIKEDIKQNARTVLQSYSTRRQRRAQRTGTANYEPSIAVEDRPDAIVIEDNTVAGTNGQLEVYKDIEANRLNTNK